MSRPEVPASPPAPPPPRRGDPAWYTRRWEYGLYLAAAVTYIGFGMFHKWLLNWVIGPMWLVAWVWLVPALIDLVRRSPDGPEGPP